MKNLKRLFKNNKKTRIQLLMIVHVGLDNDLPLRWACPDNIQLHQPGFLSPLHHHSSASQSTARQQMEGHTHQEDRSRAVDQGLAIPSLSAGSVVNYSSRTHQGDASQAPLGRQTLTAVSYWKSPPWSNHSGDLCHFQANSSVLVKIKTIANQLVNQPLSCLSKPTDQPVQDVMITTVCLDLICYCFPLLLVWLLCTFLGAPAAVKHKRRRKPQNQIQFR